MNRVVCVVLLVAGIAACGDDGEVFAVEKLRDPNTCMECHPQHFQQWSGSMHAYASDDPVFVAMNKRGQRETGGKLGDFCLKCHAPMALELGLASGATFDPATLPPEARGITCYFCHNVKQVVDDHNNGLVLANDQTMRGGLKGAISNRAHRSAYDTLMDSDVNSSEMCGGCHDIVVPEEINGVPGGVAVERTLKEWKTTFFATSDLPGARLSCGSCHMPSKTDVVADAPDLQVGARENGYHEHMWPAVDQALSPFPEMTAQADAVARELDGAIAVLGTAPAGGTRPSGGVCLTPFNGGTLTVRIDGLNIGHKFPSGAAQDRRAWLEVIAYDTMNNVVFQSGVVPDKMDPEEIGDPELRGYWDQIFKADNTPAHFFWEIVRNDESRLLKQPVTLDKNDPAFDHSITERFNVSAVASSIDKITVRVRMRALAFEALRELVASGDLDAAVLDRLPTLDIPSTASTWTFATRDTATGCNQF
ncbi:MAG TPA: multiheme c-type cytochrome [Kofleriaceae bacterium]|nr:multiheme c-type cytochrome [Kofleriaceae bacterium]